MRPRAVQARRAPAPVTPLAAIAAAGSLALLVFAAPAPADSGHDPLQASLLAPDHSEVLVASRASTDVAPDAAGARVSQAAGSYHLEQTWRLPPELEPPAPDGTVRPFDLALGPDGKLFVADGRSNSVLVFDRAGALIDRWLAPADPDLPEGLVAPIAVDVADDGTAFVVWQYSLVAFGSGGDLGRGDALAARAERRGSDGAREAVLDVGSEISNIAWDATRGELVLADPTTCELVLVHPESGVVRHRVSSSSGCAARVAAAGPDRYVVVSNSGTAKVLDADGTVQGSLAMRGAKAKDVVGRPDGSIAVLVTPGTAGTEMVLVFDARRVLQQTLTREDLRTTVVPRTSWPWAFDQVGDEVALTTATDRFIVKAVAPGGDREVTGDLRHDLFTLYDPARLTAESRTLSVTALADGRVAVLDAAFGLITAFDGVRVAEPLADLPAGRVQDVASGGGAVFVSTDQTVIRLGPLGWVGQQPIWSVVCACGTGGGRLYATAEGLWVTEARNRRVLRLDPQTGVVIGALEWPGTIGTWPSDLAGVGPDLFTAELMSALGQRWVGANAPAQAWLAGLVEGPLRLAASAMADGSASMAGLFGDGAIQLYSPTFGQLLGRFVPEPPQGEALDPSDIALFPDGRVVVADTATRSLRVFAPGAPPTPVAEPSPTPPRTAASCTADGDKWAYPDRIRLGESAAVTLTLNIVCPQGPVTGSDVLLVVDSSSSMTGEPFERAIEAAVAFAFSVDTRIHRLGVIAFRDWAQLEFPLSHNQAGAVRTLEDLRVAVIDGPTDLHFALRVAQEHLNNERLPGRTPVIVLLSDGRYSGAEDPRALARTLRESGVIVVTIALGSADRQLMLDVASSPVHAFVAPEPNDLIRAYREILKLVSTGIAGQVIINDEMGPAVDYLAGSARPVAGEAGTSLSWGSTLMPTGGITFTYRIQPSAPGLVPTNSRAVAWYTDADGHRRWFEFPIPEIMVEAPSPTPSDTPTAGPTPSRTRTATATPSSTPTAKPTSTGTPSGSPTSTASATASPRPTGLPMPLFLPVALRQEACLGHRSHVTVALVVDASTSMLEPSGIGGTKLEAAQNAVRVFLDRLDLDGGDAASLVVFNDRATVLQQTTTNRGRLEEALTRMDTRRGTRLDLGVEEGHAELILGNVPGALPVLILLTDGLANPVPADVAVARAAEAKQDGIQIYTIGLGPELDLWALQAMASSPEHFLLAPTGADLAGVYERIAVMVPCEVASGRAYTAAQPTIAAGNWAHPRAEPVPQTDSRISLPF